MLKLSKRQEKAIGTALDILYVILNNESKAGERKLVEEAIDELIKMRDESLNAKAREKSNKEYFKKIFDNPNIIEIDGEWSRKKYKRYMNSDFHGSLMEKLLRNKGFSLNTYPEGKFWELTVEEDESLKEKICKIFNAEMEVIVNGSDVETLILQCTEDFTKCIFYYDCNPFNMETNDFMKCVRKI